MSDSHRFRALACGLMALGLLIGVGAGLATPAIAAALPSPPVAANVDDLGVDLTTGQFRVAQTSLSIGGSGSGLTRDGSGYATPYTDNFSGGINWNGAVPGTIEVKLGQQVERFNATGSGNVSQTGSGNTLICDASYCDYTLKDGTVARFQRNIGYSDSLPQEGFSATYGLLVSITKPDSEVISLTYRTYNSGTYIVRSVRTVSSSLGWAIKYRVQGDNPANYNPVSITIYNSSIDACDPNVDVCSLSTGRTLSLSGTANVSVTDPEGHTIAYNGLPQITSLTLPSGVTKYIGWSDGKVSSVTIGGSTWTYSYSVSGALLTTTRIHTADGSTRALTYDTAANRVVSLSDERNLTTSYAYDANGRLYRVIGPEATYSGSTLTGGYTEYAYDGRGNVIITSVVSKNGTSTLATGTPYPTSCGNIKTCNKPSGTTDANGVTIGYLYDSTHGGILTNTAPAIGGVSAQTRYGYSPFTPYVKDASGTLVAQAAVWRLTSISACMSSNSCAGTADERKTVITYGTYNILPTSVTVSRGDGSRPKTTSYTYDSYGNVIVEDGPITGTDDAVYYFYDALNRVIGVIGVDADGAVGSRPRPAQRTYYDGDGRVWKVESGITSGTDYGSLTGMSVLYSAVTEYNASTGLPAVVRRYDSGTQTKVAQASYDSHLRIECVAQRMNPSAFGSLPASACTLGTTGSAGKDRISKYAYNVAGDLLTVLEGYGTAYEHYQLVNTYDPASRRVQYVSDAKGNRTTFEYDGFGRHTFTYYPTTDNPPYSNGGDFQSIGYDGGRVSSVTLRGGGSIAFSYDAAGRLSGKSGAVSETFSYNNFGQVTSHTANGLTSAYTYDVLGWKLTDTQPLGTVSYEYDDLGRRTKTTYPGSFDVLYAYNTGNELTDINAAGAAGVNIGYDTQGRRASLSRSNGQTTSYGYDTSSRLNSLSFGGNSLSLSYNPADQVLTRTNSNSAYTYAPPAPTFLYGINGLNQITDIGGTALSYDARGNLTGDGGGSFAYDANNLLTSADQSGVTTTLSYDAENRLHSVSKNGVTTKFLYDGTDIIAEYDAGNNLLRRYVYGDGTDEPLVWFEGSGTGDKRFLHTDQLGSVVATSDGSGTVQNVSTYNEYGLRSASNASYASRFGFTGQVWLSEIGMYYYKARLYNPVIGRFMQTDPIGYGDGSNVYAYVGNDPVNSTDPTGLEGADNNKGDPKKEEDIETVTVVLTRNYFLTGLMSLAPGQGAVRINATPSLVDLADCEDGLKEANKDHAAISRAIKSWGVIYTAAKSNNINPNILAALGIRETGFQNIKEKGGGNGWGVFQLTNRPNVSQEQAFNIPWAAAYASNMLKDNVLRAKIKFGNLPDSDIIRMALIQYNHGTARLSGDPDADDSMTTGGNYSKNVMMISKCFDAYK